MSRGLGDVYKRPDDASLWTCKLADLDHASASLDTTTDMLVWNGTALSSTIKCRVGMVMCIGCKLADLDHSCASVGSTYGLLVWNGTLPCKYFMISNVVTEVLTPCCTGKKKKTKND